MQAGYEAVDAALAAGRSVVPIFGLTAVDPTNPHGFVDTLMDVLLDKYVLSHTLSTVLQDWMKSRRSEVDQINGRVVDELRRVGRTAPVNDAVVRLAHGIERGDLKRSTDHVAALREALSPPV
jgi:2-dehydropantoate 2-reductase